MQRLITLLSDFGIVDSYVAEMKAVILSINPQVTLVDITHQIPKYNIKTGAYLLERSAEYFPRGTIHLAVVDPEVGSLRNPILAEAETAIFIGPDNGLLIPAARKHGLKHVYKIENERYMNVKISSTFHGRDIFAPAAAYISLGVSPSDFGREVKDYVELPFTQPKIFDRTVEGEIIHVDAFGNIVTNIRPEYLKNKLSLNRRFKVCIGSGKPFNLKFSEAYYQVAEGDFVALTGSGNFIELSVNKANAAEKLKAKVGMKVKFEF